MIALPIHACLEIVLNIQDPSIQLHCFICRSKDCQNAVADALTYPLASTLSTKLSPCSDCFRHGVPDRTGMSSIRVSKAALQPVYKFRGCG